MGSVPERKMTLISINLVLYYLIINININIYIHLEAAHRHDCWAIHWAQVTFLVGWRNRPSRLQRS